MRKGRRYSCGVINIFDGLLKRPTWWQASGHSVPAGLTWLLITSLQTEEENKTRGRHKKKKNIVHWPHMQDGNGSVHWQTSASVCLIEGTDMNPEEESWWRTYDKSTKREKKIDTTKINNVQFVVAKPQSPSYPPLFHRGERSPSVVGCDRLRVIKPLMHCCSCSRANPHRTLHSLTSERCNLLSRRHEVLLTNAQCQRQSRCEAVAQIKMLQPRKLLNIWLKPFFF